ncbi:hypothetical protein Glove_284g145 [Diversispora epigaea]|uniref:Uncharacterized protein n=1 Tax=Diversispora epigaea TaxID=1348612 RepID=A0A397I1C5_9GLOM|nr:hypothetical protein Glove_284g145 [Diversispora epigaea]
MDDKAHRSKDFCKNRVEHFGAYRRFTSLPYTSANTASGHNLAHRPCVDNLLFSLVPLSTYVNKFIQDNYENIDNNVLLKDFSFKIEDGFIKIEDNLTVPELELKNSAKLKYYRLTRQNNSLAFSAHCFDNPGCIVDQNNRTLIHLENIDDKNALFQATEAVNKYYFHLMDDKAHRSKDFCKNRVEHFGAYRRFTSLPYTSANTASGHNLAHRPCVDNLLFSLVPLSTYVNKFIQDNYENMYLKLRNLSWGPFAPKPFGIFPMIAINFNALSNYHWDKLDAPNCLCCLVPLGNFQGGELYFPQLHTLIPLQPGQVVAFSSHYLLHGNFPLVNGIRHSVVYFVHNILFQEEDNLNNMEIDNAELNLELKTNRGLNSKTPTFTKPRKFQTKDDDDDYNNIDQRRAS